MKKEDNAHISRVFQEYIQFTSLLEEIDWDYFALPFLNSSYLVRSKEVCKSGDFFGTMVILLIASWQGRRKEKAYGNGYMGVAIEEFEKWYMELTQAADRDGNWNYIWFVPKKFWEMHFVNGERHIPREASSIRRVSCRKTMW